MVRSEATGDIVGVDTNTIVPRLGATWDVAGDGGTTIQATYAHYAGKYSETQIADNTPVGTPNLLLYEYSGPAGEGLGFAPGFDLSNYTLIGGSFPLSSVFFSDGLHSPVTKEFTLSVGRQIGARGAVKAAYQWRDVSGFIEDFINDPSADGKVTVIQNGINFGTFDKILIDNSDEPKRTYQALVFQSNYRFNGRWSANAHWTIQFVNDGTFEGEAANQPGNSSLFGNYPEMYTADYIRNEPDGRLNDFQRHKVRAWTTYLFDFGAFGGLDASLLWRYNSAQTYSLFATAVPLSAIQRARNPGYALPPTSQTLFFDERGTEYFDDAHQFDVGIAYNIPIFKTLRPWVKLDVLNLFNDQSLVQANTTITPDPASPVDADGLATGFIRGAQFGTGTQNSHYPRAGANPGGDSLYARTYLVTFGVRF
jgi:hypothetical protein